MGAKTALHNRRTLIGNDTFEFPLSRVICFWPLLSKAGKNLFPGEVLSVGVSGINAIRTQLMQFIKYRFMFYSAQFQPGGFIKSIKVYLVDHADPIHGKHMDLHAKLDAFVFLAPDNGSHIRFGKGYNPVFKFFGRMSGQEMLLL